MQVRWLEPSPGLNGDPVKEALSGLDADKVVWVAPTATKIDHIYFRFHEGAAAAAGADRPPSMPSSIATAHEQTYSCTACSMCFSIGSPGAVRCSSSARAAAESKACGLSGSSYSCVTSLSLGFRTASLWEPRMPPPNVPVLASSDGIELHLLPAPQDARSVEPNVARVNRS